VRGERKKKKKKRQKENSLSVKMRVLFDASVRKVQDKCFLLGKQPSRESIARENGGSVESNSKGYSRV
jgi:hypothetical protein